MEGVIFHWIAWMSVISIYFFMGASSYRTQLLIFTFATIIFSSVKQTFYFIEWNLAWVCFILLCLFTMRNLTNKELVKGYFVSIIIANCFFMIHRAAYLEPVWLLYSPQWMIVGASMPLLLIFLQGIYSRMYSLILGMFQGMGLSKLTLAFSSGMETVGETNSMFILDVISLLAGLTLVWSFLEYISLKLTELTVKTRGGPVTLKSKMNA